MTIWDWLSALESVSIIVTGVLVSALAVMAIAQLQKPPPQSRDGQDYGGREG